VTRLQSGSPRAHAVDRPPMADRRLTRYDRLTLDANGVIHTGEVENDVQVAAGDGEGLFEVTRKRVV
jgi:hypothetical protein